MIQIKLVINALPWYISRNTIKEIIIEDGVTHIGSYAFYNCTGAVSITIPDSVVSVGDYAFEGSGILLSEDNLEGGCLYIGTKLVCAKADFSGTCTIKEGTTHILKGAFRYRENLNTIVIPESVTEIGENAFYNCSELTRVYYNGDIENWCGITFANSSANPLSYSENLYFDASLVTEIVIPHTITEIKPYAFYNYAKLQKVTIPASVTKFGTNAFKNCTAIAEVYYNGTLTEWCEIQFEDNYATPLAHVADLYISGEKLVDLIVPASVGEVLPSAFRGCSSLESVVISDGIESLSDAAFADCTNLKTVSIPDSVKTIGNSAFYNCRNLKEIIIPDSVETIGNSAFYNCDSLATVSIPGTVDTIGSSAFNDCCNLRNVVINSGVKTISNNAFYDCYYLVSITVPNTVTKVGESAFSYCGNLANVYYDGTLNEWIEMAIASGNDYFINANTMVNHSHNYEVTVLKEATCVEQGRARYTCSCGLTFEDITPAIDPDSGHTESDAVEENRKEPTCTEDGSYDTVIYCSVCNVEISRETTVLHATGHGEKIFDYETPATCTESGMRYYKCSVCGLVGSENKVFTRYECPESYHNYYNNTNSTKSFSSPGANQLVLKFSSSTQTESGYDYIYIYNKDGSLHSTYTGTQLSGKTIELEGDSFSIKLTSDSSNNAYGYSFDSITAVYLIEGYHEEIPALGHTEADAVEENRTEPTCTEDGSYDAVVYCSVCNAEISRETIVLEAFGHTESDAVEENRTEPTCAEDGSYDTVVYCSVCNEEISRETIVLPATGHGEKILVSETAPTCTETGMRYYKCSVCGFDGRNEVVYSKNECPESSHNYSNYTNSTKSFSSPGAKKLVLKFSSRTHTASYDYIYIYNKDGSLYGTYSGSQLSGKTIELEGDSFSIKLYSDYSGTSYGYSFDSITAIIADAPDDSYQEEIPALGHTESDAVEENRTEPNCTEDGSYDTVVYCSVCNAEISRETTVLTAPGHEKTVASETSPTCTETGMRYYKCSVCGFDGEDKIVYSTSECPQSSHNYANYTNDTKSFSSPGAKKLLIKFSSKTKTEGGYDYIYIYYKDGTLHSSHSGIDIAGRTIELEGDSFSINLTSDGSTTYYGYSFDSITAIFADAPDDSYQEEIPATGHSFGAWVVTTEPTMTKDGVKTKTCSSCGDKETDRVPKTGITVTVTDADGKVVKEQVISGDMTEISFEDIADGEYTVTLEKETYATRTYTVTATGGELSLDDFKLNKIGDMNGDGKINAIDVARANAHAKGVNALSGYDLACVDVNGDGRVNAIDVSLINAHSKGTKSLW